ncbi:GATA-type domain-containing protein [Mycena kentingensis (nom. inval.)]|nr:GATA-type domain-containing protein [Mycena kentingensis (nom. inval.)]
MTSNRRNFTSQAGLPFNSDTNAVSYALSEIRQSGLELTPLFSPPREIREEAAPRFARSQVLSLPPLATGSFGSYAHRTALIPSRTSPHAAYEPPLSASPQTPVPRRHPRHFTPQPGVYGLLLAYEVTPSADAAMNSQSAGLRLFSADIPDYVPYANATTSTSPSSYPPLPGPAPGYCKSSVCRGHLKHSTSTPNGRCACGNASPTQWRWGVVSRRMVCSACGLYERRRGVVRRPELETMKVLRRLGGGRR